MYLNSTGAKCSSIAKQIVHTLPTFDTCVDRLCLPSSSLSFYLWLLAICKIVSWPKYIQRNLIGQIDIRRLWGWGQAGPTSEFKEPQSKGLDNTFRSWMKKEEVGQHCHLLLTPVSASSDALTLPNTNTQDKYEYEYTRQIQMGQWAMVTPPGRRGDN